MTRKYHFTESGLSNVWLMNGYTARTTRSGGGISMRDVDGLHRAIGQALICKSSLDGSEVRFLRKEMGLSQKQLGDLVGVKEQAVSLWERKGVVPRTAERLIRLIYVEYVHGATPIASVLLGLNDSAGAALDMIVAQELKGRWKATLTQR